VGAVYPGELLGFFPALRFIFSFVFGYFPLFGRFQVCCWGCVPGGVSPVFPREVTYLSLCLVKGVALAFLGRIRVVSYGLCVAGYEWQIANGPSTKLVITRD